MAKKVIKESKGCGRPTKGIWWWNVKVQATVRFKKISIEAYLDVETMSLVKNIKWQRGKQKRLSKRLDLRLMTNI